NIKLQLALKMIDDAEPRNIVGRTSLAIDDLPGRGLIKLEDPTLFQAALPTEGEETLDIIDAIQAEAKEMDAYWTGERPEEIPMIPEVLDFEEFVAKKATRNMLQTSGIPIGLDFENVLPIGLDYKKEKSTLILGDTVETVSTMTNVLMKAVDSAAEIDFALLDNNEGAFKKEYSTKEYYGSLANEESYREFFAKLQVFYEDREDEYEDLLDENEDLTLAEYAGRVKPFIIFVPDMPSLLEMLPKEKDFEKSVATLIQNSWKMGMHFVLGGISNKTGKAYDAISDVFKQQKSGIVLTKLNEQHILEASNKNYNEPSLLPYEAYYTRNNFGQKLKLPKV
ncbi:MAG: type VII secretion protein EssC, partial [Carnobacterium sp.]